MAVNIYRFLEQYNKEYDFLYEHRDNVAGYSEAVAEFDKMIKVDNFNKFVGDFNDFRAEQTGFYDFISSDREAAAFMFALYEIM